MRQIPTNTLGKILKWSLIFVFIFGLFFTPFCHYMLHILYGNAELNNLISNMRVISRAPQQTPAEYYAIVAEIYALGIVMLGIVFQLIKICRNIEKSCPFDMTTHGALKSMAFLSLALVVVYIVKFAAFPSLPTLLVAFTFIIIGMISSVFSQLFKTAAEYKEENDFTV